jgi:hypothetical protein
MVLTRDVLRVARLPLCANMKRAARALIADLVDAWATVALIGDTPCLTYVSYLRPLMTFLVVCYILKLTKIWQTHYTCISNI